MITQTLDFKMAGTDLTLFYFPGSYYSMRAVLALYEKQLPFKDNYVSLMAGEHLTDSYMKINPKGQVPVLKDGDKFIAESEDIVDYLDKTYKTGTALVPDESTPLGKKVRQVRECINPIRIEVVTFGILLHRQFSVTGLHFAIPKRMFSKEAIAYKFTSALQTMDAKLAKETDPAMREALQKKKTHDIDFRNTIQDPDKVALELDGLEPVFDKLEALLETSRKEAGGKTDYWLCDDTFTAADLSVAIFFYRLRQVGVDERYFNATKRPLVHAYNERLLKRPSIVRMKALADSVFSFLIRTQLKSVAKKSVKIFLVTGLVGLGAYGIWKYCNKDS